VPTLRVTNKSDLMAGDPVHPLEGNPGPPAAALLGPLPPGGLDEGARGDRLGWMQAARGRELRQTMELLMSVRKAENKGQAAGDGGKIEDRDNDAIEMPGPDRAAAVALSPSKRSRGASQACPRSWPR
jgi:hypothetical protein